MYIGQQAFLILTSAKTDARSSVCHSLVHPISISFLAVLLCLAWFTHNLFSVTATTKRWDEWKHTWSRNDSSRVSNGCSEPRKRNRFTCEDWHDQKQLGELIFSVFQLVKILSSNKEIYAVVVENKELFQRCATNLQWRHKTWEAHQVCAASALRRLAWKCLSVQAVAHVTMTKSFFCGLPQETKTSA